MREWWVCLWFSTTICVCHAPAEAWVIRFEGMVCCRDKISFAGWGTDRKGLGFQVGLGRVSRMWLICSWWNLHVNLNQDWTWVLIGCADSFSRALSKSSDFAEKSFLFLTHSILNGAVMDVFMGNGFVIIHSQLDKTVDESLDSGLLKSLMCSWRWWLLAVMSCLVTSWYSGWCTLPGRLERIQHRMADLKQSNSGFLSRGHSYLVHAVKSS